MVRQTLLTGLTVSLLLCLPLSDSWGRGFGGGGGRGGAGGGGLGGGAGRSPGGLGGGGFGGGAGHGPGGLGGGGFAGGGAGPGRGPSGFGGGQPGGAGFGGPGAAGAGGGRMGDAGFGGARGGAAAGGFGQAGLGGFGGPGAPGFGGNQFGGNRFAAPNSGQLNNFLGMPSDDGLHQPGSFGVGRGNIGVGGDAGIGGGRAGVGAGGVGRPGVGVGGIGRPGVGVGGLAPVSASARYTTAAAVRTNYNHWGYYGRDWYARYPSAWSAAGWATGTAWRACAWSDAAAYCGYTAAPPVYYDYGNNITYQDNSVYVDGQDVGSGEQYYDQAAGLASTGAAAEASPDADWLPLGVFALTESDKTTSDVSIQLAVNKQGVIRGNSTDTVTNKNQVVQGSVDKQTQRVAFTVGDNTTNVVETGLYNLTKDEAPCLIHFGKDKTEQWLLVRLHKPDAASSPSN